MNNSASSQNPQSNAGKRDGVGNVSRSYQPSSSDSKSTKENRLGGQVNREIIELDGIKCWALIDSGSVVSSISEGFYNQHCTHIPLQDVESICDLKLV